MAGNLDRFIKWWVSQQKSATVTQQHAKYARDVIGQNWELFKGISSVLDVGCGGGETLEIFKGLGIKRCVGVTNQKDEYLSVKKKGFQCVLSDMHYLETKANRFDLVYSRRVVEHSPVPFYLLGEFARISKKWIYIITPNYPFRMWHTTHCSVVPTKVWEEWAKRLDLKLVRKTVVDVARMQPELRMIFQVSHSHWWK